MKRWIAIALLAGCGSSSKPAPAAPPVAADPTPCDDVAANEIKVLKVGFLSADSKQKMHASIVGHCTNDGWSVEARTCIAKAADDAALDACKSKLTQAQLDATKSDATPSESSSNK